MNVLPWEQDETVTIFLSEMEALESDLRARRLNRTLNSVDSKDKPHTAFEYLAQHEHRLKNLILELDDTQTGQGLKRVQLADSKTRRASRGQATFADPSAEFNAALDDLADLAHDIHSKVDARLMNTTAEERWVMRMRACLDLRAMAYPLGAAGKAATTHAEAAAKSLTSAASMGLKAGDRIEICVEWKPINSIWWPATLGAPIAGAGIHGISIIYDAFQAQGYDHPTPSRIAFECLTPPCVLRLWDAEENAWYPWRSLSMQMDVTPAIAAPADAAAPPSVTDDERIANAAPTDPTERAAFDSLLLLLNWMNSRWEDANNDQPAACPDPMPSIGELWEQRKMLTMRLQMFASDHQQRWANKSGTVIMETIFTEERFNERIGDFLHLFKHCALKTSNEAVVEGMGSYWDDCAAPKRHLRFETGVEEAVICYTAPPAHLPEATSFLRKSLTTYFDGGPHKWNFSHEDARHRHVVWAGGSKVIDRLGKIKPRLPSAFY